MKRVRVAKRFLHILVILGLLVSDLGIRPPQPVQASTSSTISYVYDDLGRLKAVTDPASDTAIYSFDAVGNVLGISRQSSSLVSVIQAAPSSAPIGASVTIFGTGFSTTPSQNTVAFNGNAATVTSSTSTQIVATVPTGATSGPISVTSPSGSATSSTPFTIGNLSAPTISSFSPTIATPGTAVTISGTNFDPSIADDRVAVNTTLAQVTSAATSSVVINAPNAGSGRISVTTPNGNAISAGDLFIPPSPYSASSVAVTGRISFGQSQTVTINTAGTVAMLLFDGTANQLVSVQTTNNTIPGCQGYNVSILKPDGTTLIKSGFCGNGFIDTQTLPVDGTYTLVLDPNGSNTDSATLTLYTVVHITGTITPGGSAVTPNITTPGQNAYYTFSGTANQIVSVQTTNTTIPGCTGYNLTILKPDGSTLANQGFCGNGFMDIQTLPVDGTYTLVLNPSGANTGNATITLYNVVHITGTITPGGSAVTANITTPGQNAYYTFSGTANQQVTASTSNVTIPGCVGYNLAILNPDGSTLVRQGFCGSASLATQTLPTTGTYTLVLDPNGTNTGQATLALASGGGQAPMQSAANSKGSSAPASPVAAPTAEAQAADSSTATPVGTPTGSSPRSSGAPEPGMTPTVSATPSAKAEAKAPPPDDKEWIPDSRNLKGDWTIGLPSPAPTAAPLQATSGVTALSGIVKTLQGQPLPGVTLQIGDVTTQSDENGQFLLAPVKAGFETLVIDGSTANHPGHAYGRFEDLVQVTNGETNVLPYTIWMTRLDTAHAVDISSPTTSEVVLTDPHIPGLEIHIPAGSTITDDDGNVITKLSLTALPVDRPPFPLPPNVNDPVYFTVQPGGAYVGPKGAWIVYPNYTNLPPGTRVNFWNYDPDAKGWYIYGLGTVTKDGKQIVPDPGVVVWSFSGAMFDGSGLVPPSIWAILQSILKWLSSLFGGDPVDLSTGLFILRHTDLVVSDIMPITLTRVYRPSDSQSRPFGIGSTFLYDMFLWSANQYQEVDLILPDGSRVHYVRISPGTGWTDAVFQNTNSPTEYYMSKIAWNGNGWNLTLKDGTMYVFGENAPLQAIVDRFGNRTTILHSNGQGGNVTEVRSPNGRWIQFTYDSSNRIIQAQDDIGRTVSYTYDGSGRLSTVTDPNGGITTYTYDSSNNLLTIKDAKGIVYLTNQYDANNRVIKQTRQDGTFFQFNYTLDSNGNVTETDVTDPRGNVTKVSFSGSYPISVVEAAGKPEQETTTFQYQPGSNLLSSVTDALGRVTSYAYDAMGNVTGVTRLSGTPDAVTTSMTYEPTFNQLTSITDPLNHVTSFAYDSAGNLTTVTDPLNHQTALTYNSEGEPLTATDPLNHTIQFAYDHGDLVSVTDPLGNTSTRFVDSAGRLVSVTDPLGRRTRYDRDVLNRLTKVTDPLGNVTAFAYDPNGNLLSVTDARNNATTYAYDNMDRLTSRTDPLQRAESYQYDANSNLSQYTDRKNQVTTFAYDALDRLTTVTYNDNSTTTYSYDAGDRTTQIVDSISGTISPTYDNLDRLTQVTSPQGTVSYGYDAAGRRTSMTVAGQPAVSYTYDNANRLTQITQGTAAVGFAYDEADRRTNLTLPNGIAIAYSYDQDSRLAGLTYALGSNTLGDLSYTYDPDGQRLTTGGSFARTGLPQAINSATYDQANELTQWGATTPTYDANGNLTSDGTNTYTWNARDQLASINGTSTVASFSYDAFGRRTSKTISGTTTGFLYDGSNPVQELSGTTPSANLLTGLAVDEYFTRTDSTGTSTMLPDALGSTVGLADSSGTVQTQYTYDPFGNTTSSGAANGNAFQYTGRENDGTGLYYNRARYYSPTLQRFISEDPLGFGGGDANLYTYVGNDPTNLTDPSGQFIQFVAPVATACAGGAVVNVAVDVGMSVLGGRKVTVGGVVSSAASGCVAGVAGLGLGEVLGIAADALLASTSTRDILQSLAEEAYTAVSRGNGPVNGTLVHSAFRRLVTALGRSDLHTEINYLNGKAVLRNVAGSVRLDVVEGPLDNSTAVYDLKTGSAKLTAARIAEIRSHLPNGGVNVPIVEIPVP